MAHREALLSYSGRALKPSAVARVHDLRDLRTLMHMYEELLGEKRVPYIAVRAV